MPRQLLLGLLQAAPHRVHRVRRVVVQHTVVGFQIQNLLGIHHTQPIGGLQRQLLAAAALHAAHRPPQLDRKRVIFHRLQDKIERLDLIAANGVLRQIGHEHQHHVGVYGADAFRGRHTAQHRHFDVQKDNVKPALVRLGDLRTVRKIGHHQGQVVFLRVAVYKAAQALAVFALVIHHRDIQHRRTSLLWIRFAYIIG